MLGRASNIKSTKDFINLLTEYKEYIPKNLKSILENSTPEFEDSMLEFHKYFLEKQNVSTYLHARQLKLANNYLLEYAQTLPA